MAKPLITAATLRAKLGFNTYMALYDEDDSGSPTGDVAQVDASEAVALTLRLAHVRVVSRLATIYPNKTPDGTDPLIDDLLVDAELNYAVGISYDRHPEYVNRFGWDPVRKGAYQMADDIMASIQDAVMRLVQAPPEPKPANVGGVVVDGGQRVFLVGIDGTPNTGDW
jgi:hypothetical protein